MSASLGTQLTDMRPNLGTCNHEGHIDFYTVNWVNIADFASVIELRSFENRNSKRNRGLWSCTSLCYYYPYKIGAKSDFKSGSSHMLNGRTTPNLSHC
jgi:hypothetical protein